MKRFICLFILLCFLVFVYAKFIEPTHLKINEYSITNSKIPSSFDGMKIVHFSDVLYESPKYNFLKKSLNEIKSMEADIIVFTGDLIKNNLNEEDTIKLTELLSDLKPQLYKYAVLGDHDNNNVKTILENSNFIVLDNESKYIFNKNSEPILIAGGNNLIEESLLQDENIPYNYKIALTHKPDNYDNLKDTYDLVLSGHSLGGEIRLPFIGAIVKKSGSQKYTDNIYHKEDNYLYVSFGLGIEKTNMRLLNPPSINVYRIYSK